LHLVETIGAGKFSKAAGGRGRRAPGLELSAAQLSMMLEGIDLTSVRQRLRFHRFPA
jgi:hypothetical protein